MVAWLVAAARRLSEPRMAWGAFAVAAALLGVAIGVQQASWEPAYTDYAEVGARYTFPLNGKIAQEDGVSYFWARCGHDEHCGPIAFRGTPSGGLDHVVLKVPSQDPAERQVALPRPVPVECAWQADCPASGTTNATMAWGVYDQAPIRLEQAAVAVPLVFAAGLLANVRRGPVIGARAALGTAAGAVLAAGLPVSGLGLWLAALFALPALLLVAGFLKLLARWVPSAGSLAVSLLWASLGWFAMTMLFAAYFPGPPEA